MLPAAGYFKDIDCPCHDTVCGRPYCHFRHRKKKHECSSADDESSQAESAVADADAAAAAAIVAPTYRPTPKSELASATAKSHIPISYVPDLVRRSDRALRPLPAFSFAEKPTYKPTPISILSSSKVASNCEYVPGGISENINFGELDSEFEAIDEILSESVENEQAAVGEQSSVDRDVDDKLKQDEENKDVVEKAQKNNKNSTSKISKSKIKKLDEVSKLSDKKEKLKSAKKESNKEIEKNDDKSSKITKEERHRKDNEGRRSSSKSKSKEKERHKSAEEKLSSSHKHEKKSSSDKDIKKSSDTDTKNDKKSSKSHKHSDKKANENSADKKSLEKKSSSSHNNSKKSEDQQKMKKNHDKESRSTHKKEKHKSSSKSKIKDRSTKKRKISDDDKTKYSEEDSDNHKQKSRADKKKRKLSTSDDGDESAHSDYAHVEITLPTFDDFDIDIYEEGNVEEECYKIFNEYKPTPINPPVIMETRDEPEVEPYNPASKKRIAHDRADEPKLTHSKPKTPTNYQVALANRFKLARQMQADNEQKDLMCEINKPAKRPPMDSDVVKVTKVSKINGIRGIPKPSTSVIDDILSGRNVTINTKPRIAPVANVLSIQRAKAQLDEMKAANAAKTPCQTLGKGTKRVAHIPDRSLSNIPDVLQADRSKLPLNVRTRFLTMLAEECVKLYCTNEDAYQRALNEEFKSYEKCKTLATYRNSTMLAVNRVRKEVQEREATGLGPFGPGETGDKSGDSFLHGKKFYESVSPYLLTEDELVLHGYPREGPVPGKAIITKDRVVTKEHLEENERLCCRCHKVYLVDDDGFALIPEQCCYHPLKKRTLRGERTYLCCKSTDDLGCAISDTHVSEISADRELEGFQSTMPPERDDDPRSCAVYALDCEMCYTTVGLELTRVTIVDTNLKTIYESLVKPLNAIIDYNTRFSGITPDQMERTSTSILQVQANILHLCNSKTILIGHSLESDMKALKIIHDSVIDTSVMFPHKFGLPHKRALRVLASEFLRKIIQNDVAGHDSAEDALACMELVIWKVKEDLKARGKDVRK